MSVARFVEMDDEQLQELFGDGGYREEGEEQNAGLFSANRIDKATLESCIKRNYSIQRLTYNEVMSIWTKKKR